MRIVISARDRDGLAVNSSQVITLVVCSAESCNNNGGNSTELLYASLDKSRGLYTCSVNNSWVSGRAVLWLYVEKIDRHKVEDGSEAGLPARSRPLKYVLGVPPTKPRSRIDLSQASS